MGKPDDFIRYGRQEPPKRPVEQRIRDHREYVGRLPPDRLREQAARCTDCGIPFCHQFGCPVKNLIPDWNEMVSRGHGRRALDLLHATNNLPEVTGRLCPAPCEPACTMAINEPPVLIKQIELEIVENGWEQGWIQPVQAPAPSGKKVAVIGSGPAGLSAAQQIVRSGHQVVVFERSDRPGGLLRYGIPDFKMEKWVLDRRIQQMQSEGVLFETGVEAGQDISARYLQRTFDALVIAVGAGIPRDLDVPGRALRGIHPAMDFLCQQNRRNAGRALSADQEISARGKNVVVIGGGDTGSDCVGTARRQGAREIFQIELLPRPPEGRAAENPWPTWPRVFTTSASQEEGCTRLWSTATKRFSGENDEVRTLHGVELAWSATGDGRPPAFSEIPGSEFELKADLVLLAMGFLYPEPGPLVRDLDLQTDARGTLRVDAGRNTSAPGVFACGDAVLGASLIVRAIDSGRCAAASVHRYLTAL
jgi:glutamate synthase (NADPH) small chain